MFGDTPPVVIAVDGALVRQDRLISLIEQRLVRHPLRLVSGEADALRTRLAAAGLRTGPGLDVATGSLADAVALAAERGAATVRVWVADGGSSELPMPARVAAHDAGIRLRLEAPLEALP